VSQKQDLNHIPEQLHKNSPIIKIASVYNYLLIMDEKFDIGQEPPA